MKENSKEPKKEKIDYISVSGLKGKRNWTDSLIKKFLGEPDKLAVNPHYSTAPKMKLYILSRAVEAEELPEFKTAFVVSRRRSEGAKNAEYTRVESVNINGRKFVYPPSDILGVGSKSGSKHRTICRRFLEDDEDLEEDD